MNKDPGAWRYTTYIIELTSKQTDFIFQWIKIEALIETSVECQAEKVLVVCSQNAHFLFYD